MRYLADTDWAIEYMRGRQPVRSRLEALFAEGVGISIVSIGELYDGVFGANDVRRAEEDLRAFLEIVQIVPLDEDTCRIFARERRRLRESGQGLENLDLLIGATAIRRGLTLLTNNRRHFARMEGLSLIASR